MLNRWNVAYLCLPINSSFFKISNLIDEEINVLLKGMLCLRTLEFFVFDEVKASIRRQVRRGLDLNRNFYVYGVVSYRNTSELLIGQISIV